MMPSLHAPPCAPTCYVCIHLPRRAILIPEQLRNPHFDAQLATFPTEHSTLCFRYPYAPSVDSWKWFDSRRMTNICERWSKDHTNALQYALFNGDGFESWENVWFVGLALTSPVSFPRTAACTCAAQSRAGP